MESKKLLIDGGYLYMVHRVERIAEIMAIAPRSVLMLRHRFRQKIGMSTEYSLENFIADLLEANNSVSSESESSKT